MEKINSIIWSISTVMLVLSGLYFAFKLDFLHLKLRKLFKVLERVPRI